MGHVSDLVHTYFCSRDLSLAILHWKRSRFRFGGTLGRCFSLVWQPYTKHCDMFIVEHDSNESGSIVRLMVIPVCQCRVITGDSVKTRKHIHVRQKHGADSDNEWQISFNCPVNERRNIKMFVPANPFFIEVHNWLSRDTLYKQGNDYMHAE